MSSPSYSILFSAKVDGAASAGSPGDVLIPDSTSGEYVKATAANRGTRRAHGIALTSYVADGTVEIQQTGVVSTSITGLGAGVDSWVRTSSSGTCERCTPGSGDDIIGKCDELGNLYLQPGTWDDDNYAGGGGGGGGTPGGSDTQLQYNAAGSFGGISGATSDGTALTVQDANFKVVDDGDPSKVAQFQCSGLTTATTRTYTLQDASGTIVMRATSETLTNKSMSGASNTFTNISLTTAVTGTLPVANGGTAQSALGTSLQVLRTNAAANGTEWATVSATPAGASGDIQTNSAGSFGSFTPGTGVVTFLTTPSGANLATALTTALPASKGGTGLTSLGTNVATFLGTPSGANLASALTTSLPNTKGGTGGDSSGSTGLAKVAAGTWSYATLLNADVNAAAAIAGTKISPDFGSQNVTTTGVATVGGLVNTSIQTSSSTGTINDFALSAGVNFVRLTGAAPVLTGITGGTHGRRVVFHATAGNATFNGQDAGSTAANRITTALNTVTCYQFCAIEFFYDGTSQRWIVMTGIAAPET